MNCKRTAQFSNHCSYKAALYGVAVILRLQLGITWYMLLKRDFGLLGLRKEGVFKSAVMRSTMDMSSSTTHRLNCALQYRRKH